MASKGKSKNKKNNKYATAQKEKLSASDFFVGFGKWETFSFCIGLLIGVIAIFMTVAFVSYLFTGDADYSLLESQTDPLNSELRYKNVCGSWGAIVAFFFLNNMFGLASFIMLPYMIILAMRMMRIFKFTLIRKFILFTVLMLWVSVFLSAFGYLFPYFEGSFVKLGGNHGIQVVKFLTQLVGTPGLLAVLLVTAVLYLIYLSAKTIEVIRNLFRLNFLKKVKPERWKQLMNKDEEEDDSEEDEEEPVYRNDEQDKTVVVEFDSDELNVPVEGKNLQLDESNEDDEMNETDEVDETDEGEGKKVNDVTKMDIEAKETEKGSGKILRGDIAMPYDPKLDLEHYKYPTLNLLRKADDQGPQIDMFEQNANKNRIIEVLRQFGVEIKSIKATIGPTITLYEIVPAEGTRINKIRNLEDDIALSLAADCLDGECHQQPCLSGKHDGTSMCCRKDHQQ